MKGKRGLYVLLSVAAVLAWTGSAFAAGLALSNHNMILRYNYPATDSQKGACSFCHIPHGAGAKLYGATINTTGLTGDWSTDTIAQICFQCHGGIGADPEARNVTVFDGGVSHSNAVGTLTAWGESEPTGIHGMAGGLITCTSCHDVHNNEIRPFLRSYAAAVTEGNFQSLCVMCHDERAANANTGTRTQHPTGVDLAGTWAVANILAKTAVPAVYKSTWADLTREVSLDGDTWHWNLGAKFDTASTDTGSAGGTVFGCGTCHATHNNELAYASFAVDDGLGNVGVPAAIASPGNALQPESDSPTFGAIAAICDACHATPAVSGPGAVNTASHPWATQTTSGAWPSGLTAVNTTANGAKFGSSGTERSLDCQACHDMHYARVAATTSTGNRTDCNALIRNECGDCHSSGSIAGHHPSGIAVTAGTNVNTLLIGGAPAWSALPVPITEANREALVAISAAVRTTGTGDSYPTTGGVMTCGTCHGASAAHNVTGTSWAPGVIGGNTESGMCVDCHSINPSIYTATAGTGAYGTNAQAGTHWVGAVYTVNYKWNAGAEATNKAPATWTGLPKYGAAGTNGSIICESCHVLKFKAAVPPSSNNTTDDEADTRDAVGLLLKPAGNSLGSTGTWDNGSTLCTACHGAAPGTGVTHPVLPTVTTAASTYIQTADGTNDYVTLTTVNTANQINCESCHRPHDAKTAGYSRILEDATTAGGFLNETVMCINCHGDTIPVN